MKTPNPSIAVGTALLGILSACEKAPEAQKNPNVLFILCDDLGYGDISCYGTQSIQTPNIDRIAQSGIRFTDAHCASATSTPSRYGLLTGAYPWRRTDTGVARGDAGMVVRPEEYTMADLFQQAGYTTAAFGKWHLGLGNETGTQDWNKEITPNTKDIGFDYSFIMAATGDRVPCVYIRDGRVVDLDPDAPIEVSYTDNFPGEPTGKDNPELLYNLKPSHGHDMSIVNGISRIGYMRGGGRALWKDEEIADRITEDALAFLDRQDGSKPFFMYFCPNNIHVPRFPNERFRGKSSMGLRGDAILELDDMVGRVLDKLEEIGQLDNTLIVFTSDNGPVLDDGYQDQAVELVGDHRPSGPYRGGKYSLYEGGTRVPLLIAWADRIKERGKVSDELVSQIDFLASFGTLIGAEVHPDRPADTRDALPAFLGEGAGRDWIVEEGLNRTLAYRTAEWKYIRPVAKPNPVAWQTGNETGQAAEAQLYRIVDNVYEEVNVADQYPEVVAELDERLQKVVDQK